MNSLSSNINIPLVNFQTFDHLERMNSVLHRFGLEWQGRVNIEHADLLHVEINSEVDTLTTYGNRTML